MKYDGISYATFGQDNSTLTVSGQDDASANVLGSIMAIAGSDVTLVATVDTENSTAVEGVDFTLESSSIVIPAGEVNGNFVITANHGSATTSGKTVVLNISSPDVENATFNTTHTVNIILACPLPADFALSYGVQVQALNQSFPTHLQTITPVPGEDNTFKMESIWGPEFVATATGNSGYSGQYVYSGQFTINCDDTVTFTGDDTWATGGTGTYNPETGFITGTIGQTLFTSSNFTVDITMIPAQ